VTATVAYGLEVLADEPTPSPISKPGRTVMWEQTRTLLLADGSTAYGCIHCDYVSRSVNSIRPHLSKHNRRPPTNGTAVADGHRDLTSLLGQLHRLDELVRERDQWKARALKAERSLKTVREAIG
jgi:hypothetical protein